MNFCQMTTEFYCNFSKITVGIPNIYPGKVIIVKSPSEMSLLEQELIENVYYPIKNQKKLCQISQEKKI